MLLDGAAALRFAIEALAPLRDLARLHRVLDDDELVAGHRHAADSENLNRNCRTGRLDGLARARRAARARGPSTCRR